MSPRTAEALRRAALPGFLLLLVLALLMPRARPGYGANGFGVVPHGQRALFELLVELGLPVARSFRSTAQLAPEAVVWWVAPQGLCRATEGALDAEPTPAWLEAGGQAVVFLDAETECERLAGFALPGREFALGEEPPAPPAAEDTAEAPGVLGRWWESGLADPALEMGVRQRVAGRLTPRERWLEQAPLRRFAAPGEFEVAATLDGSPFALERRVGQGRLLVVADAGFLMNRALDRADAAPLALDFVRAVGVPLLDERAHGLRGEQRAHAYLARSRAAPVFLGLAIAGLLAAWLGTALPPRAAAGAEIQAPELERYVDSLAALYARSRDHAQVLAHHRVIALARLRSALGLPPETPESALLARLRRGGRLSEEALARLAGSAPAVRSATQLRAAAARIDALVEEACA